MGALMWLRSTVRKLCQVWRHDFYEPKQMLRDLFFELGVHTPIYPRPLFFEP